MRKWFIAAAVAALAMAVALALAVSRFQSYVEDHQAWVADQLSAALHRSVSFDDIAVSFRGGLSASATNLRIAEDPRFGDGDFIRVQRTHVVIRVLPALFGNYEIRQIQLDAPQVRVIRDHDRFNFTSLAQGTSNGAAGGSTGTGSTNEALAILVALLQINDGQLSFVDRNADPPATFEIEELDGMVTGASLDSPVGVELAARLPGAETPNFTLNGQVGPIGDRRDMATVPVEFQMRLAPLSLDILQQGGFVGSLPTAFSMDHPVAVELSGNGTIAGLSGALSIEASDSRVAYGSVFLKPAAMQLRFTASYRTEGQRLRIEPAALHLADAELPVTATVTGGTKTTVQASLQRQDLHLGEWTTVIPALAAVEPSGAADVQLSVGGSLGERLETAGKLTLRDTALHQPGIAVTQLNAEVRFQGGKIEVPPTRFAVNGSPVEAEATYEIDSARYAAKLEARGVALKPILEVYAPEVERQVGGKVDADVRLTGMGFQAEAIRRSLAGNGRVDVRDGVLRHLNVGEAVLTGATGVGGLTQLISPAIRKKYPGLLQSADTFFDALGASFQVAAGVAETDDLRIMAKDYVIDGRGTVSLDNRIDMRAVFVASEDLTDDLVKAVKPSKYLKNKDGRLEIPFALDGAWPKVRPQADERALLERLGRSKLGERLNELLGGKSRGPDATPAPEADLLRKGLDRLFRH